MRPPQLLQRTSRKLLVYLSEPVFFSGRVCLLHNFKLHYPKDLMIYVNNGDTRKNLNISLCKSQINKISLCKLQINKIDIK